MSIKLMSDAWDVRLPSFRKKFVLLALCDGANDAGECYSSVAALSEKCCLSEFLVVGALRSLLDEGFVSQVVDVACKDRELLGGETLYRLRVPVRSGGAA